MKNKFLKIIAVSAVAIATSAVALTAYATGSEIPVTDSVIETTVSNYNNDIKSPANKKTSIITKFKNTATGTKITWAKNKNASKYGVYCLVGNKWKKLAVVSSTSYTHENLKTGTTYTYSIRCFDKKGKVIGSYDKDGLSNTFYKSPVVLSVNNIGDGVEIKWKAVDGITSYRVYRKVGKSNVWRRAGSTSQTSLIDKKVNIGQKYTYAVVCLGEDGKLASKFSKETQIQCTKLPEITAFENTSTGIRISWQKVSSAEKYGVFYLNKNSKWKRLAIVGDTHYTHKNLKDGIGYTYKIRCLNDKGKYFSNTTEGKSAVFVSPVGLTVSLAENGTLIQWKSSEISSGYKLYRKELNGSWEKLADFTSETSFTDITAEKDKIYGYAVRCLDEDDNFINSYPENTKFYINGSLANGKIKIGKKTYRFKDGIFRSGLQTINGKKYYYDSNGTMQKNGIVGSSDDGWYYADKNGVINFNYVNGIEQNGKYWIVSNGKATVAKTRSDKVLYRAAKEVAKATDTSMTKEEKLQACFDYVKKAYIELNPRIPHYLGMDWPIIYADDMFIDGAGNCCSYGSAFAFMAKAIGYEEIYCCNSGGHGWAEIEGLVYDPEWSRHFHKYTYYALDYDTKTDQNYKGAIAAKKPWMRIKI